MNAIIRNLELAFNPVLEPETALKEHEVKAEAEQGACAFDDLVIQISEKLDNSMDRLNSMIQRRTV